MLKDRRKCLRFDIPLDVKFKSKEVAEYSLGVTIHDDLYNCRII